MQFMTNSEFDKDSGMAFGRPPPRQGRRFYSIQPREDGRVDVYLMPDRGVTLIVRGVTPWEGLEEDIRARYYDWCASAEIVTI